MGSVEGWKKIIKWYGEGRAFYFVGVECLNCGHQAYDVFDKNTPEGEPYENDCPQCGEHFKVRFTLNFSVKNRSGNTWLLPHLGKFDSSGQAIYKRLLDGELPDILPERKEDQENLERRL